MNRLELTGELYQHRLVAVVRSKTADQALALAQAAAAGGVKFIEITFSVPGALDVIKDLAARKGLHVGAGTVLAPPPGKRRLLPRRGDADGDHRRAARARRSREDISRRFGRRSPVHPPDAGTVSGRPFHGFRRREFKEHYGLC